MTKTELMELLDKRLSILNEAEREDIKQDYEQHIEMKMGEGMTEEEAVDTLGDIESIIDETLMAYNIDPDYDKKAHPEIGKKIRQALTGEFAQKTGETLNKGLDAVHRAVKTNSPGDLLKFLLKIFLYFIGGFAIFAIGFAIVRAGAGMLEALLPSTLGLDRIVSGCVIFLYVLVFVLFACSLIYNFINKNSEKLKKEVNTVNGEENSAPSTSVKLFDILIFIIKICVVFAVLPCFFMLAGTMVAQGLLIAAVFTGYPAVGLCLGCLGVNICTIVFLIFIFKLVFAERRVKNEA